MMVMKKPSMFKIAAAVLMVLVATSAWLMPPVHAEPKLEERRLICNAVAGGGAWNDNSTWTGCSNNGNNGVPTETDVVQISGADAVVTIPEGYSAAAAVVVVVNSATLNNAGSLSLAMLQAGNTALVSSTGKVNMTSMYGQQAYLYCVEAEITFAHGLTMHNDYPTPTTVAIQSGCKLTIDGSLELTSSQESTSVVSVVQQSQLTVNGDLLLHGGLLPGKGNQVEVGKRGGSSSVSLVAYQSTVQVAGDLRIVSISTPENNTYSNVDTLDAFLELYSAVVSVGGSVEVRSGDAFLGNTGHAMVFTNLDVLTGIEEVSGSDITSIFELSHNALVVGGSLTVESGSVTGLRTDGGNGYGAGDAMINLVKAVLLVNGSADSGIIVRSGHAGNSTASGGTTNPNVNNNLNNPGPYEGSTQFIMGLDCVLAVAKDLVVQSGNAGSANVTEGNDDGYSGAEAKPAFFRLLGGVEAAIGGNLIVLGGHGGDTNDIYGSGGRGGPAMGALGLGGSLAVGGDVLISSGSAGQGQVGGQAYHAGFYVGTNAGALGLSGGGIPNKRDNNNEAELQLRQPGSAGSLFGTGKLDMRVGGSVTISGGMAGSSNYSNDQGGQCNPAFGPYSSVQIWGGFIVENAWEGNVEIGGDFVIEGCMPGDSVGGQAGTAGVNGLLVVWGGSVSVGGSVSITSADGGSVMHGSDSAGNGGSSFTWVLGHATLDVAGSLTLTSGNGGHVIDGTGAPGSGGITWDGNDVNAMLLVGSNSHVTVGENIAITGGNGGSVDAALTPGSSYYGGAPLPVLVGVIDVSSVTVGGNMALLSGAYGNSSTNMTSSGSDKREEEEQPAQRVPLSERIAHILGQRAASNKADSAEAETSPVKRGIPSQGTMVEVYLNSKLHVAGDFTMSHQAAAQVNNLNPPVSGLPSLFLLQSFAEATIEGNVAITGGSGGILTTNSTSSLAPGGIVQLYLQATATLRLGGNVVLQGGDAAHDANGNMGLQGVAGAYLSQYGEIHQSGSFRFVDGQGVLVNSSKSGTVGVYMVQSQWTVYPCPSAGLQLSEGRNSSASFLVEAHSSFRDCRSASVSREYGSPYVDGSSCAPCSSTCSEAPFNSCPNFSSASRGAQSALVACVRALLAYLGLFF